jgi:ferric-dicitrate binding protein FerR (iron transport regulator)
MKKTILMIVLCSAFVLPARADTISGGKITSVDAGGTSFSYSKKKKNWRFKVTDKTVIRVGDKTGNPTDLKTGQSVKVEYRRQDNALTALIIIGIGF